MKWKHAWLRVFQSLLFSATLAFAIRPWLFPDYRYLLIAPLLHRGLCPSSTEHVTDRLLDIGLTSRVTSRVTNNVSEATVNFHARQLACFPYNTAFQTQHNIA